MTKQTTIVVIGALRVKNYIICNKDTTKATLNLCSAEPGYVLPLQTV